MSTRLTAAPWERVYDIHGVRVALKTNSSVIAAGAEEALAAFSRHIPADSAAYSGLGAPLVRMEVLEEPPAAAVPADAQPQFRHAQVRCFRHGDELWYTNGRATMVLNPPRGTAQGHITPFVEGEGEAWRFRGDAVFTFSLLELLRHRGLYHLHAAGLARDGRGVLMAGNTGAGKSTLAVSMVRSGWDFLSDDAVLLRGLPGGVEALAIPDAFHLDPALSGQFPELAVLNQKEGYNGGPKRALAPGEVYNSQATSSCLPSLLLFPQIAIGTTRAEALAPTQALAALIRTSALVLLDERVAASHLDALRRLVAQCRCYALYHGPDALNDPNCVPEMIEALLPGVQRHHAQL